jgi:hypothetical protein
VESQNHPPPESSAQAPSLTSAAYPVPVLPAVSGFQVPDIIAQAPAELQSDAPLPLQKSLPDSADVLPARNKGADIAYEIWMSYSHSPKPSRLT